LVSGEVARDLHSPIAFLSVWVLGGAVALAGALSNGELGGLYPRSGGEYIYLREAYGPAFGFLSGWTSFWVVFPGSIAALAAGFGDTVGPLLGFGSSSVAARIVGGICIAALTIVNALGLRPGKWTQNVLSTSKLAAFVVLLTLGIFVPRDGPGTSVLGGLSPFLATGDRPAGFASALIPVLFAYSGWNAAAYVAGEMKDPARTLGRALGLGTLLCVALYVVVNAVYLRALPLAELAASDQPARAAVVRLGGPGAAVVLSPLVAVCVLSSMQASVLVGPRVYHAMAVDGLFFAPVGRVHPRTKVPLVAIVAQGAVAIVQLATGSFAELVRLTTFAIVAFSTLTVAAVIILRMRRRQAPRAFAVPGYPWTPLLFVSVNGWLLWCVLASGARSALIGLAIVATGIPAYLAFRARRARTRSPMPGAGADDEADPAKETGR
jgi:APA family basic amino acid/polyamine antiporter